MSYYATASNISRFSSKLALCASLSKTLASQVQVTARPSGKHVHISPKDYARTCPPRRLGR